MSEDKDKDKSAAESKVITVAVPRDLASRLRVVAAHRDMTMTQALERFLRPVIDREYRKCVSQASADLGGES